MIRRLALLLLLLVTPLHAAPSATVLGSDGVVAVLQDLQNALTATSSTGTWVDTRRLVAGYVVVEMSAAGTIQIRGSNDQVRPANNSDGTQVGLDITAAGGFDLTNPPAWIKAKVSGNTGTISVRMILRGCR